MIQKEKEKAEILSERAEFRNRMDQIAALVGNATVLAQRSGISRRSVGLYLSGQQDPSRERLVALAEAAGVRVEWLATGRGPMREDDAVNEGRIAMTPLNLSLLRLVIEAIEDGLREAGREMASAKKAELIAAVYDLYAGSGRPIERERVLRLITSAA